jgi:hypothetical protein
MSRPGSARFSPNSPRTRWIDALVVPKNTLGELFDSRLMPVIGVLSTYLVRADGTLQVAGKVFGVSPIKPPEGISTSLGIFHDAYP